MPTSYTTSLRLALPATGENNGTWGSLVNTSITQLIEDAVAGYVSVAMTDADYTLSTANGAADEARCMYVNMTGTLTQARNVICPTAEKLYFFRNNTTGGFAVTLKTSAGTGISVPNGKATILLCDGTNVVDASTHFSSLTLTTALGAASGGTGLSSYTAGDLPYATGTTTLSKLGIGTNNYVLTSSGSAPQWTANTGTGSVVRATSPTLVTPALGTPASGTLTSCTGLPISTGVSGLGTGVATFLGTPSSANLAAAVTDETGSGSLVFGTSPSLTTPTIAGATLSGTLAGTPTFSGATVTFTNAVALGSGTLGGVDIGLNLVPQNSKSADYTLVAADAGKHIFHPSADTTPRTFTIPANASVAYTVGTAISFVNNNGAGTISIAITSDTLRLAGTTTTGTRTLAANGIATALKIAATEWIISGVGLT